MSNYYNQSKVAITGACGFLASYVMEELQERGAELRLIGRRPNPGNLVVDAEYVQADLLDRHACENALKGCDSVFHLAAVGWGFHENLKRQPQLLTDNVILNTTVLDTAYRTGVKDYLFTSSSAVYPSYLQDLDEEAPWDQPPHEGESCFGWAKRLGEIQAQAYYEHNGMSIAIVRPSNPYGPRDNFDSDKSHVVPALIRRAISQEGPFVVWGTGKVVRSFVHARDVAKGMLLALEKYAICAPVNLASNETITVADLVKIVLELSGRSEVEISFDTSKSDGHPRKVPKVDRAAEKLGLTDYVPLRTGLKETIEWYVEQKRLNNI